jgi:hypothetical protein
LPISDRTIYGKILISGMNELHKKCAPAFAGAHNRLSVDCSPFLHVPAQSHYGLFGVNQVGIIAQILQIDFSFFYLFSSIVHIVGNCNYTPGVIFVNDVRDSARSPVIRIAPGNPSATWPAISLSLTSRGFA